MSDVPCPMCRDGVLVRSDGQLDQSGASHLPTHVWRCGRCEYTRFEPALHARWEANQQVERAAVAAPEARPLRAA
ncbi:hypothetical protein [Anaeromyxobacter oryzae]|uniref:Uncharacterized protein n=1 Tax=Anaeromyxobacter oryzae TaxID=2918170 RepID=A0ABM7X208_9BACT|nr:hypothetical protein [Anaeromyxobacter oryzae]BDG05826.1 hypothetical protein AMOR_48220 [Anaeromyxobacter oryzae]